MCFVCEADEVEKETHSHFLRERGGPAGICGMEEAEGGGEAGGRNEGTTKGAGTP